MNQSELPSELSDRGVWWQVGGFAIIGCAGVAVLQIWEGSDFWAYRSFAIAVKDLYWLFILPLAGLFEGVRKMFEKASEIRAAQRQKMLRKALQKEHKRLRKAIAKLGDKNPDTGDVTLTLTPEVMVDLFGESADSTR